MVLLLMAEVVYRALLAGSVGVYLSGGLFSAPSHRHAFAPPLELAHNQ
jgi:hypothetical protein